MNYTNRGTCLNKVKSYKKIDSNCLRVENYGYNIAEQNCKG